MTQPFIEFYVYKVKDPSAAGAARQSAMDAVKSYDGFLSWRGLASIDEPNLFVDYVEWKTPAAAKSAHDAFADDQRTKDFMAAIDSMVTMSQCETVANVAA